MKWTVQGFCQQHAVELGLDATDLAILRWIVEFQKTGRMKTLEVNGKRYVWVNYGTLCKELPILGISTRSGIKKRLAKLIRAGVLEFHLEKKEGTWTFYRLVPDTLDKLLSRPGSNDAPDEAGCEKTYLEPAQFEPVGRKGNPGLDEKAKGGSTKGVTKDSSTIRYADNSNNTDSPAVVAVEEKETAVVKPGIPRSSELAPETKSKASTTEALNSQPIDVPAHHDRLAQIEPAVFDSVMESLIFPANLQEFYPAIYSACREHIPHLMVAENQGVIQRALDEISEMCEAGLIDDRGPVGIFLYRVKQNAQAPARDFAKEKLQRAYDLSQQPLSEKELEGRKKTLRWEIFLFEDMLPSRGVEGTLCWADSQVSALTNWFLQTKHRIESAAEHLKWAQEQWCLLNSQVKELYINAFPDVDRSVLEGAEQRLASFLTNDPSRQGGHNQV